MDHIDLPAIADAPRRVILSIAGGGFAGLFAAEFLGRLERDVGEPLGSCFDLYAGTSVGGLMALALADGQGAQALAEKLAAIGPPLFRRRDRWLRGFGLPVPKHGGDLLKTELRGMFGDRTLAGLAARVLIPAVDLNTGEAVVFAKHGNTREHDHVALADVAAATSAAPFYLPVHRTGDRAYVDGGLVANAPDALAAAEAVHALAWDRRRVRMLAVGSTSTGRRVPGSENGLSWGAVRWMRGGRLLRLVGTGQASLARWASDRMLGADNVVRVDAVLSPEEEGIVGLDRADRAAVATLRTLAAAAYDRFRTDDPGFAAELRMNAARIKAERVAQGHPHA